MAYSSITKPTDYFNTITWTGSGNSSPRSFTGVGFQPDWVWYKCRSDTYNHNFVDAVRGTGLNKELCSNKTSAEGGGDSSTHGYLSSFDTDGFSSANGSSNNLEFNQSGDTFVAWNWLGANGTASNSNGSITTTVSANQTAGFSIVSYTGTGSAGTIGHGLGTTPAMGIFKNRSASSTHWRVWQQNLDNDKILELSDTTVAHTPGTADFNISNNSSTVWGLSTNSQSNGSGNSMIAYIFAEKQGYSKFGQYEGNANADGTFVYTGFLPAFVMAKNIDAAENWIIFDNKRPGYNLTNALLKPNLINVESTSGVKFDLLSNGFKARVSDAEGNSSATFIYAAFAENPFVGNDSGTAVPVTAR